MSLGFTRVPYRKRKEEAMTVKIPSPRDWTSFL